MVPYKTTIPGTEATFEMQPIPGGKFKLGSPASEKGHKPDEGAAGRSRDRAVLDEHATR